MSGPEEDLVLVRLARPDHPVGVVICGRGEVEGLVAATRRAVADATHEVVEVPERFRGKLGPHLLRRLLTLADIERAIAFNFRHAAGLDGGWPPATGPAEALVSANFISGDGLPIGVVIGTPPEVADVRAMLQENAPKVTSVEEPVPERFWGRIAPQYRLRLLSRAEYRALIARLQTRH